MGAWRREWWFGIKSILVVVGHNVRSGSLLCAKNEAGRVDCELIVELQAENDTVFKHILGILNSINDIVTVTEAKLVTEIVRIRDILTSLEWEKRKTRLAIEFRTKEKHMKTVLALLNIVPKQEES